MSMSDKRPFDPDDETNTIAPDDGGTKEKPLSPAEAVRREQEKYGESSLDENRGDQWDEHHGEPDDIV
jgi:hypothetical protein